MEHAARSGVTGPIRGGGARRRAELGPSGRLGEDGPVSAIDTVWEYLAVAAAILVVLGGLLVGLLRGRGGSAPEAPERPAPPDLRPTRDDAAVEQRHGSHR